MKLDDAVYAEVCVLRDRLQKRFSGVLYGAAKLALSEVATGRDTPANLDMLRSIDMLVTARVDNTDEIANSVNIVRHNLQRDAATFLTPDHLNAYEQINDTWFDKMFMEDDLSLPKRDAVCAFAFKNLSRTPYIVEAIKRGVIEPKEVRELVYGMMQAHSALSEGAL